MTPVTNDFTVESHTGVSSASAQPTQHPEDAGTFVVSEPMELSYVEVYDVDEDRDGNVDGQLYLERSDTFVMIAPMEQSEEGPEQLSGPSGG